MLQLDNARFCLVSAMPTPSQWRGPAAQAHEQQVWELIHELNSIVDSLWV
jgi:hypothetical protein